MDVMTPVYAVQSLITLISLVIAIFFILNQYRTLQLIRPENRLMPPGQEWLQLIPIFNLVWQFFVISRISTSIRNELNAPTGDNIFADDPIPAHERPTYNAGICYATLFCISALPIDYIVGLAAMGGLVAWIVYWIQLAEYKKRLKRKALFTR